MTQANQRSLAARLALAMVVAGPLVGHANEGFWPFNRIPRAAIKQALGVELTDQWVERDAYARIAQAVFATQGDSAHPDGTFTLRLSYGQVKGYTENGQQIAPFTEFRGLHVRGDHDKQQPPSQVPDSWMNARGAVKPTTSFNFVSTNDIVDGNSGSPVINARGELVGDASVAELAAGATTSEVRSEKLEGRTHG